MAGISTGISLLSVSAKGVSTLSYSTSTMTTYSRSATASPNPDYYGNTGFGSSPTIGAIITSISSGSIDAGISGSYPNYTIIAYVDPRYIGTYTANITPQIKDSAGIIGNTSGVIPVSRSRDFVWTNFTSYNYPATTTVRSIGIIIDGATRFYYFDNNTVAGTVGAGLWNTSNEVLNVMDYNEVKFEDLSGSTDWLVGSLVSGVTFSNNRSKGTYYTISNSGAGELVVKVNPRSTNGVTSCDIRITFRNKTDNSKTFIQDVTLALTKS